MRRLLALAATAAVAVSAAAHAQPAPTPAPAPAPRPKVEVIVLTLDDITQRQARYGRASITALGAPEAWGRFQYVYPAGKVPDSCEDDGWKFEQLDFCVRYYTRRIAAKREHPVVVVALDDLKPWAKGRRRGGEMSASCFGGGDKAADAAKQSVVLWPDAARVRGSNDLHRDRDALTACIAAAASEPKAPPKD